MGILNVTPDSFFDGGKFAAVEAAEARARAIADEGGDVIDIGAESTRPGSTPVGAEDELRRLLPTLERVRNATALPISVDTAKAAVARRALEAGADWVNDIWGLQGDASMADVVAAAGAVVVAMHNRPKPHYPDGVVTDIERFFERTLAIAQAAGISAGRIVLDPGIGFGKTASHSLEVMRSLARLRRFRQPLLLGASRKSFIGAVLDLPVDDRLEGTLATTAAAVAAGFDVVRVHDVKANVRIARMADAIHRPGQSPTL